MNTISNNSSKQSTWQTAIILTLGFWISATMILDWVIMPSLYFAGMMNTASFSSTGYVIFGNINHLELLAAAIVLTAVLAISKIKSNWHFSTIILALLLLTVAILDTYLLTPKMCAMGSNFTLYGAGGVPDQMGILHSTYFVLEALKVLVSGFLLNWAWKQPACE